MSLAREQWDTLELARHEVHVANGEPGEFVFLKRNDTTNGVEDWVTVCKAWTYFETTGPTVRIAMYELHVSELEVDAVDLKEAVGCKHGDQVFAVVQPSPMRPSGAKRFWVFYLNVAEGEL